MRRIIDVTSNAPRGASRYSEPRMRNRLVVDFWLSHWRLAAALKASRCSDAWNGVDVRSAVASAHCPGRRDSSPRGDPLPRRGSLLHWRLPRWRGCRLCRRLGRGSSCGVTSQNSPRAGRQQGYAGSGGCVGSPLFRPMWRRLSLGRAHRQSGEAKRPGQDAGRCGEAIDLNGNRAAAQGVKARRRGGASSERRPMQRLKPAAGADSAVATVRGPAGLLAPGASQPRVGRGSPGGRVVRRAAASGAARFVGPRLTSPL